MATRFLALFVFVFLGVASAQGGGNTLTCSATSQVAGCYVEHRVAVLGDFEVTLGVDTQVAWDGRYASNSDVRDAALGGHLAPYVGLAYYAPDWSTWLEVYMPHSGIEGLGRYDFWRLGFSLTF